MQLRELVDARAEFDFFAAELTRMLIAAGVGRATATLFGNS